MLKTRGYRKLVLTMAFVLGAGLLLAACGSGSSSSTDEALNHPGDNFLASIVVSVEPQNAKMDFQVVQPNLANTDVTSTLSFYIKSTDIVWNGSNNVSGTVKLRWKDTHNRLENVRIGIFSANGAGGAAIVNSKDNCAAYGNIAAAMAAFCEVGYTYVGDIRTDGGETEFEVSTAALQRSSRYYRALCPECGTVTAKWSLTEASGNNYKFFAHLFGVPHPNNAVDDTARYDSRVATWYMKAYQPDWAAASITRGGLKTQPLNQSAPITQASQGEWFYLHTWVDEGGNQSDTTNPPCVIATSGALCLGINPLTANNNYYLTENANNRARYDAATSLISHPSSPCAMLSNTGYVFVGEATIRIRWDPAIVKTNDTQMTARGSGTNAFSTAKGTAMLTFHDVDETDNWAYLAPPSTYSNNYQNRVNSPMEQMFDMNANPKKCPSVGDGIDVYPQNQFKQGDISHIAVAMQAIGPVGDGTRFDMTPANANSNFSAQIGLLKATQDAGGLNIMQRNAKYPKWLDSRSNSEILGIFIGGPQERLGWICVK